MSVRRVGRLAATVAAMIVWMSCGEVYRPVVIPIENNPPSPANFHAVFGVSTNVAPNPGSAMQIDVSGESKIGAATLGINPTHAAMQVLGNGASHIIVASAGSVTTGNADLITQFTPASSAFSSGIGSTVTYSLPNVGPNQTSAITAISESGNLVTVTLASPIGQATVGGPIVISGVIIKDGNVQTLGAYNGNFTITAITGNTIQYVNPISGLSSATGGTAIVPFPTFCSYQPNFVATSQTNAAYVANYGQENGANCNLASTDSIAALNTGNNTISKIAYLPAGSHPILMAETPNTQNLFVVNQGNGTSAATVLNLSPLDLSTMGSVQIGVNPAWIAMRLDGQRVYVLTQGDGQLYTIRPDSTLATTQPVGVGANYVLYEKNLNRLYVTSPASNGLVYIFSATTDAPTPLPTPAPNPPGAVIVPAAPPCVAAPATCGPVIPASVAALPDGSRFYVASYQTQSPCSDRFVGAVSCIIPMVTVFDAKSLTIRTASSSYFGSQLSLLSAPPFGPVDINNSLAPQYAVAEVTACVPPAIYTPGVTRFRMFATASADSSHVYVSICDAGSIAVISTTTNTVSQGTNQDDRLVIDLQPPFSAAPPVNNQPLPQSPVFLLAGQ